MEDAEVSTLMEVCARSAVFAHLPAHAMSNAALVCSLWHTATKAHPRRLRPTTDDALRESMPFLLGGAKLHFTGL